MSHLQSCVRETHVAHLWPSLCGLICHAWKCFCDNSIASTTTSEMVGQRKLEAHLHALGGMTRDNAPEAVAVEFRYSTPFFTICVVSRRAYLAVLNIGNKMCYHKLYIFTTCGHSIYSSVPLLTCRHASIAPTSLYSIECKMQAHPFQSLKIESLCFTCQRRRSVLLEQLENQQLIRFDDWQWKVSYAVPDVGIAEQQEARKRAEKSNKKDKGISWRRSKTRSEK